MALFVCLFVCRTACLCACGPCLAVFGSGAVAIFGWQRLRICWHPAVFTWWLSCSFLFFSLPCDSLFACLQSVGVCSCLCIPSLNQSVNQSAIDICVSTRAHDQPPNPAAGAHRANGRPACLVTRPTFLYLQSNCPLNLHYYITVII